MKSPFRPSRAARWASRRAVAMLICFTTFGSALRADGGRPSELRPVGPYNAEFAAGGDELVKQLPGYEPGQSVTFPAVWTLQAWVKLDRPALGWTEIARIGGADAANSRSLGLKEGRPSVSSKVGSFSGAARMSLGRWYLLTAVFEKGGGRLMVDGVQVAAGAASPLPSQSPILTMGSRTAGMGRFAGRIAGLVAFPGSPPAEAVLASAAHQPAEDLITFENSSPTWPLQVRTQYGQSAPQDAWTLPHGLAPYDPPVPARLPELPPLAALGEGRFGIGGWRMAEAPSVPDGGDAISQPGFRSDAWLAATVPGTALATFVDRGVYPDPRRGLNNMAIPERLGRQDYWYRTEFRAPAAFAGRRETLLFAGINYSAEVWLNGALIGTIKGAFIRGRFDVTGRLRLGQMNALAVRVSPPPHPGIPHEQSLLAGRGENGGVMMMDGPTFGATEGWDWIPGVRDRNSGIWQPVTLETSGPLTLGDAQVVTTLPNGDASVADVEVSVPVSNAAEAPVTGTIVAAFDGIAVVKTLSIPAGATVTAAFSPEEFPQLHIRNPRLWWPNGYGEAALHEMQLTADAAGTRSDSERFRFGIRHVTYELSAMDQAGNLDRIVIDPSRARALGVPLIDERHESLRKVAGGWVPSLFAGAERSPAVRFVRGDEGLSPHLVIRVNGVRIAARGGNMGMDDMMKRVDRAHLEPFFRLQREAHMNVLRNWMGQSTEEVLYDLADEYGLMVLNDFWESTQDNDAEAEDVPLFVANARDVVRRFRNHPSIVLWIGRNEGVPQPLLQSALQAMTQREDGTRLYKGNSRLINFAGSGPYNWREPEGYFTEYAKGFAVEVGTPSFPTLEAWRRAIPAADQWPIGDAWAYHDWHQDRQVAVKSFMEALATRFGPGTSLVDFERKAQMLEYESHRAIFEGFNAGLWTTNTGRLLWMTHPAWPSTEWQIYSSDYDTHAAYYGARKGAEPIHVQMNLPDHRVMMVNTTRTPLHAVTVKARIFSLTGREMARRRRTIDVPANQKLDVLTLDLTGATIKEPVLVRLEATDAVGKVLSDNFYWVASKPADLRALEALRQGTLDVRTSWRLDGEGRLVTVALRNIGPTPVIEVKATLFAGNVQVLPAYFSDNYISLLPQEARTLEIRTGRENTVDAVSIRAWNLRERTVPLPTAPDLKVADK